MKPTFAEHFLTACGCDQPLRMAVTRTGETSAENWVFTRPFLMIGRRPDSDLVLDHFRISRRHAYVQYLDGGFFCLDLGSRTGTHGGDAAERAGWIERDVAIQVGPFEVRPTWPPLRPVREPRELPSVIWELPATSLKGAICRMERQLILVGRSPSCRIRINQADVSKFHCSLIRTRMGVWVVDLLGKDGVFVNDEPVRCARLDDGDELRIGRHVLRPRYDADPPAMSESPGPSDPVAIAGRVGLDADHLPALPAGFPGKATPARLTFPAPAMPPAGQDLAAILQSQGHAIDPVMSAMVQQFGLMQQQMFDQFHNTMMAMFEGFAAMHREQSEAMRDEIEQVRNLSREIEALQAETDRLLAESKKRDPRSRPSHRPPATLPGSLSLPPLDPSPADANEDGGDIHTLLVRRLATIHNERQGRWQKILGMMSSKS